MAYFLFKQFYEKHATAFITIYFIMQGTKLIFSKIYILLTLPTGRVILFSKPSLTSKHN